MKKTTCGILRKGIDADMPGKETAANEKVGNGVVCDWSLLTQERNDQNDNHDLKTGLWLAVISGVQKDGGKHKSHGVEHTLTQSL